MEFNGQEQAMQRYTKTQQAVLGGMALHTAVAMQDAIEDAAKFDIDVPTGILMPLSAVVTATNSRRVRGRIGETQISQAIARLVERGDVEVTDIHGIMGGAARLYKLSADLHAQAVDRYRV